MSVSKTVVLLGLFLTGCFFSPQLSPTAIKDYNRGRSYLSDLASRKGVPVFDTVSEAVHKAAQLARRPR